MKRTDLAMSVIAAKKVGVDAMIMVAYDNCRLQNGLRNKCSSAMYCLHEIFTIF